MPSIHEEIDEALPPADNEYDDEEDENQEIYGLTSNTTNDSEEYDELSHSQRHSRWRARHMEYDYIDDDGLYYMGRNSYLLLPSVKTRILIGIFVTVLVLCVFIPKQHETEENPTLRKFKGSPQYMCPTSTVTPNTTNEMPIDVEHFRSTVFRNYNKTYDDVKDDLRGWKVSRFVPHLKNGDSIFESECGNGLNLLLTLEILRDENLRDLHVYGSDRHSNAANVVLDEILTKDTGHPGKRGVICQATDLGFVPSNSFDLTFSGFMEPLPDPWDNGDLERRREICRTKEIDWKAATLWKLAMEQQETWYAEWVTGLVRIAKPGAPVIVEMVSEVCDESLVDPWGLGVRYDFWKEHAEDWDVEDVQFELNNVFPQRHRYNVFMKKRKHA